MTRFAIRGLLGRKVRAVLTGVAIVLGVAMISGTYILTDTIDRAFSNLFTESYAGTDAVVQGEGPDISFEGESAPAPPVEESLLETVRDVPEVELATGAIYDETSTKILEPDGDAVSTGGAPSFGFGIDTSEEYARFNPLNLQDGRWPSEPGEVVIDAGTVDEPGLRARRHGGDRDARAEATLRARRRGAVRRRQQHRDGDVRGVHDSPGAGAARPQRAVRLDLGRGEGGGRGGSARRSDRGRAPRGRGGAVRDGGGGRGPGRDRRVHLDHPHLLAHVRGRLALRGRVRHLQHLLDHGRAADAGVRDSAHDRGFAPAGAGGGDPRVARDRHRRLAHRPGSRAAPRRGDPGDVPALRLRAAVGRPCLRVAHGPRVDGRRRPRDACRRSLPGDPSDARAADRGRAGGSDAPSLADLAVRPLDRRARRGRCAGPARSRPVHRRPGDGRAPAVARRRRPAALHRRRARLAARRPRDRDRHEPDRPLGGIRPDRARVAHLAAADVAAQDRWSGAPAPP